MAGCGLRCFVFLQRMSASAVNGSERTRFGKLGGRVCGCGWVQGVLLLQQSRGMILKPEQKYGEEEEHRGWERGELEFPADILLSWKQLKSCGCRWSWSAVTGFRPVSRDKMK